MAERHPEWSGAEVEDAGQVLEYWDMISVGES